MSSGPEDLVWMSLEGLYSVWHRIIFKGTETHHLWTLGLGEEFLGMTPNLDL